MHTGPTPTDQIVDDFLRAPLGVDALDIERLVAVDHALSELGVAGKTALLDRPSIATTGQTPTPFLLRQLEEEDEIGPWHVARNGCRG
jgi:hypothetical protein